MLLIFYYFSNNSIGGLLQNSNGTKIGITQGELLKNSFNINKTVM